MNVDNLSTLNNEIKSGLVWVERIKLNSDIINNGTNDSTGIQTQFAQQGQYSIIPIIV